MLKLTGKDLQERLELRFPDYARRERERIEILRRLRAGEITDQISPYDKSRVETAVVQMESQGGLATLVPGGFILTATHCIKWDGRGKMALGVPHAEPVRTPSGLHFRVG